MAELCLNNWPMTQPGLEPALHRSKVSLEKNEGPFKNSLTFILPEYAIQFRQFGKNSSLKKHKILGDVSLPITDRIYDRKNTRSLMLTPGTVFWTFIVEKNMDLFQNFLINNPLCECKL